MQTKSEFESRDTGPSEWLVLPWCWEHITHVHPGLGVSLDSGSHPRKQDCVNTQESTRQAYLAHHGWQKLMGGTWVSLGADETLLFLQGQISWGPHRQGTLHSHLYGLSFYPTPLTSEFDTRTNQATCWQSCHSLT